MPSDAVVAQPVLNFRFLEAAVGGGHTQIKVFAGFTLGSLGLCGGLVMRSPEWDALRSVLAREIPAEFHVRVLLTEPEEM